MLHNLTGDEIKIALLVFDISTGKCDSNCYTGYTRSGINVVVIAVGRKNPMLKSVVNSIKLTGVRDTVCLWGGDIESCHFMKTNTCIWSVGLS